ncbi:MAG: PEP-CTERM sorting domain-containing protein [bacterium]
MDKGGFKMKNLISLLFFSFCLIMIASQAIGAPLPPPPQPPIPEPATMILLGTGTGLVFLGKKFFKR